MSLDLDPQASWIQWLLTGIATAFSSLILLLVSFRRETEKIYREKVDALEKGHSVITASYITREEFKEELTRRADETDNRTLQMHNHNAALLAGIDSRIGELRGDIKDVHKRIDESKK